MTPPPPPLGSFPIIHQIWSTKASLRRHNTLPSSSVSTLVSSMIFSSPFLHPCSKVSLQTPLFKSVWTNVAALNGHNCQHLTKATFHPFCVLRPFQDLNLIPGIPASGYPPLPPPGGQRCPWTPWCTLFLTLQASGSWMSKVQSLKWARGGWRWCWYPKIC